MKKCLISLALFLASLTGLAQQATVTATISSYAGGSARGFFINEGSGSPTINQASGTINSSGVFSLNAWNNSYSVYAPSVTQFIICGPTPYASTCYSALVSITSSSQDISSAFSGAPTPGGGGSACATCVVASSPGVGIAHFAGGTQTVTSSLVGIADLSATGTASNSTFLRGDNTWAAAGGGLSGLTTGFIPKALSSSTVGNSAADDGVTNANGYTYGGSAGFFGKSFNSTDTVNNGSVKFGTGSGGDTTCPTITANVSYLCTKSFGIYGSINGGTYSPVLTQATAGPLLPLYLNWTFNSGAAVNDAAPRVLAAHAATISTCYLLTTASDGTTSLVINIFDNGTTIFAAGAQTVANGTAAGTITTLGSLAITSIASNDKFSVNITSGTSSWVFSVQCK